MTAKASRQAVGWIGMSIALFALGGITDPVTAFVVRMLALGIATTTLALTAAHTIERIRDTTNGLRSIPRFNIRNVRTPTCSLCSTQSIRSGHGWYCGTCDRVQTA